MLDDGYLHLSTCHEGIGQLTMADPSAPCDSNEPIDASLPVTASVPAPAPGAGIRIPSVLIVDDNPGDVELLRVAFEMSDIAAHIESAGDGLAALQQLAAGVTTGRLPDLVLLDLNMPRANGLEVLGSLRRSHLLDRVPVVVLSTSEQMEDRRRCLELGAREFHTKPEKIRDLVRLVQSFRPYLDSAAGSAH